MVATAVIAGLSVLQPVVIQITAVYRMCAHKLLVELIAKGPKIGGSAPDAPACDAQFVGTPARTGQSLTAFIRPSAATSAAPVAILSRVHEAAARGDA